MSGPGYILMPQTSPIDYPPNVRQRPSFPLASPPADPSARIPRTAGTFKAPAHKHAHHLHSIPPREKSTRTLIIDHMSWIHGRTRFAQARAELGMTDRTGGPISTHYVQRERPENYDEDDDIDSEGEDVDVLCGGHHVGGLQSSGDDRWSSRQDLPLARALRVRAEGLEKVITSMLDQPPELRPSHPNEADYITPPASPKQSSRRNPLHAHPHTLPDGVRLRLALGTIINDLFARESAAVTASGSSTATTSSPTAAAATTEIHPSLLPLIPVSNCAAPFAQYTPAHQLTPNAPLDPHSSHLYAGGVPAASSMPTLTPTALASPPRASLRPRCARHLASGCLVCLEPSGRPRRGGIGSGLSKPGARGSVLRRSTALPRPLAIGRPQVLQQQQQAFQGSTRLANMLPRFLRLSALCAMELGREARDGTASYTASEPGRSPTPTGGESATSTMPMPSRGPLSSGEATPYRPSRDWYMLFVGLATRAALEGYASGAWRGAFAAEVLFGIGVGGMGVSPDALFGGRREQPEDADEFAWFDPDELPGLQEAAGILFSSGALDGGVVDDAEAEFRREMRDRLRKFLSIPASTTDLLSHLLHLSALYPAEAVERAALRFCEAVAKWRGKPELQSKGKHNSAGATGSPSSQTSGVNALPLDLLVRSNPESPTQPLMPSFDPQTSASYATPSFPSAAQFPLSQLLNANKFGEAPIQRYFLAPAAPFWLANANSGGGKRKRAGSPDAFVGDGGGGDLMDMVGDGKRPRTQF
ncbi:hypothetical protein PUNSTDRAFT_52077 [Punctularia strigosozonata HHB-11173 SS5]|uniref:uncharacterized protein n=1 Tax=Punctularia strigosozonata (strain HHB-11173) TaxID=741275 RepID=UPI000441845B|nr:uncharacterized protein PUNSTDRAFT_52077 [Punctularia strigosozonata HHB-11173 SS5]EIN09937.1 hypothetical protein PUNSTDRAFT_52077 [Punctularia strigosozonata HHB-11173 SS5]